MVPIPGFPRSKFQTGDETRVRIQADMGFVAEGIFGLFDFLAFFVLDLASGFDTSASMWVMRPFAFVLPFLIFGSVHVRHTMYAIHDLNGTKSNPLLQGNLDNLFQHVLENLQIAALEQPLTKDRQGRMVRCFLINCQAHKILGGQVLIDIDFHLAF
jgi:hypothetical protein